MGKTTENRIRRLERNHRPPPYREVSFGDFSEEEYVELIKLGRAALAGDTAAEAILNRKLAKPLLGIADKESKVG